MVWKHAHDLELTDMLSKRLALTEGAANSSKHYSTYMMQDA